MVINARWLCQCESGSSTTTSTTSTTTTSTSTSGVPGLDSAEFALDPPIDQGTGNFECGSPTTTMFYTDPFEAGTILYYDAGGTLPATGINVVVTVSFLPGQVWVIEPSTGEVIENIGQCS